MTLKIERFRARVRLSGELRSEHLDQLKTELRKCGKSAVLDLDEVNLAVPIGPHWMILWPFDAKAAGLSTVMRDGETMVMFAGTPYAHLHISGSPWEGSEYRRGDHGIWTMRYEHP